MTKQSAKRDHDPDPMGYRIPPNERVMNREQVAQSPSEFEPLGKQEEEENAKPPMLPAIPRMPKGKSVSSPTDRSGLEKFIKGIITIVFAALMLLWISVKMVAALGKKILPSRTDKTMKLILLVAAFINGLALIAVSVAKILTVESLIVSLPVILLLSLSLIFIYLGYRRIGNDKDSNIET